MYAGAFLIGVGMRKYRYELVPCTDVPDLEIIQYNEEFHAAGEDCYVLWLLEGHDVHKWKAEISKDRRTRYIAFLVCGKLVGIGRITLRINNVASGNIGYGIRPSKRGRGFAHVMIHMMTQACYDLGLERPTACIDVVNEKSVRAFASAGWIPSGIVYDWKPNPGPRKAVEYVPKTHHNS